MRCESAATTPISADRSPAKAGWADVAREVASRVAAGSADQGVLFCWTGTGVSIAANKVPGVRTALCGDPETARGARAWNDANVLFLSLRTTTRSSRGRSSMRGLPRHPTAPRPSRSPASSPHSAPTPSRARSLP
jgi:RpiB/LacA/LacB family sugar-phosphate isomerase